jgi:hypothetical protein
VFQILEHVTQTHFRFPGQKNMLESGVKRDGVIGKDLIKIDLAFLLSESIFIALGWTIDGDCLSN